LLLPRLPAEREKTRRFVARFSLLTILLLFALVGCGLTIWQLWREVKPLRDEVRHLRNVAGFLTIDDPTRVHAIRAQTSEQDVWRWRVHIPEGGKFFLHVQPEKVPLQGLPERPYPLPGLPLKSGENSMELRLSPSAEKPNQLDARLVWNGGGSVGNWPFTLEERDQNWIENDITGGRTDTWPKTLLTTESVEPGEPMVLLRLRATDYYAMTRDDDGKPKEIGFRPFEQPCDGLMIWIDEQQN
jgi:hypothetical protein